MSGHIHRKTLFVGLLLAALCMSSLLLVLWPFETLSKLAVIAAVLRGALIVLVMSMAFGFGPKFSYFQRASLGLTGAAMTMTVQSLLIEHTPYELWSAILATLGLICFMTTIGGRGLWERIARLAGEDIE